MARDRSAAGGRVHLLIAAVVSAGGMGLLSAGTVAAEDGVDVGECDAEWVCTGVEVPSGGGSPNPGGDNAADEPVQSDGGAGGEEDDAANRCYVVLAEPQPPASDPSWEGQDPESTTMYHEVCNWTRGGLASGAAVVTRPILVADGEDPPEEEAPSPAQLAQQAMDQMLLEGPEIGIAPDPSGEGAVGVPVWMWSLEGETTTGPNSSSASAGGVTVTAVAVAETITWSMGDGETVTCEPPGTPYEGSSGVEESPDCGHVYTTASTDQPEGRYRVEGVTTWEVRWEGGGQSGVFRPTRTSATTLAIGELAVLN